jgi:hypothetical protein
MLINVVLILKNCLKPLKQSPRSTPSSKVVSQDTNIAYKSTKLWIHQSMIMHLYCSKRACASNKKTRSNRLSNYK